jgi:uncharacterized protein YdcH (DUF465 family)
MTSATDTDIREIKDLISALDKKIDVGFTKIDGKFDAVNARLTNLETNTKTIADLAEKVGELKNWKQIAIVIFTATVGGAIGWFIRTGKI